MLRSLSLEHVGPAASLKIDEFAQRFNLITGDNGLGKSFLLDIAWWSLTSTWTGIPAVPSARDAVIRFSFDGKQKRYSPRGGIPWDADSQRWKRKKGRPPNPGLVIYARVDGSFSLWDPLRNYRLYQRSDGGEAASPEAYQFTSYEVLHGLKRTVVEAGITREQVICAGLIDDWTRWQESRDPRFDQLCRLLSHLGPEDQALVPGEPVRPTIDDQRMIPTIKMPYGHDVPLTYAPAGIQRTIKLAYLLTWTFSEHLEEAGRTGKDASQQIIVLIDEPETHLHPRWQRSILPSLAKTIESGSEGSPRVQLCVATHSPLVLASVESIFDAEKDALWVLAMDEAGRVSIEKDAWRSRGDANRWLTSDVFQLRRATSRETEEICSS